MKNKIAIFCISALLMLAGNRSFGQAKLSDARTTNILKINFFLPGLSYEQKLGQITSLHLDAYIDALIINELETGSDYPRINFTPSFKTEMRTYYNLINRDEAGKRIALNSANYFSILYLGRQSYTYDYSNLEWVSQVGVVWGLQRNAPKGFSIDFNLGLAYTFNSKYYTYYHTIQPLTQLRLGYWLGRKSK